MQFFFFWIPVCHGDWAQKELNTFLARNPAVNLEKHFVNSGAESGWAVSVVVSQVKVNDRPVVATAASKGDSSRLDYRELLSPGDFEVFSQLRVWRKERAASEGVPIYTVATNEQLAAIAQKRPNTRHDLDTIEGLGKTRMKRYSDEVLKLVATMDACQKSKTDS